MSQAYLTTLWREVGAWRDVEAALREQRTAIVKRQVESIWDTQDLLQDLLRQAACCRAETHKLRPAEVDPDTAQVEQQATQVRLQVRDALSLNHELLKDICCYLEMVREVVFPQTLPPTYGNPRRGRVSDPSVTITRARTA